jgi:hypothetical protein
LINFISLRQWSQKLGFFSLSEHQPSINFISLRLTSQKILSFPTTKVFVSSLR